MRVCLSPYTEREECNDSKLRDEDGEVPKAVLTFSILVVFHSFVLLANKASPTLMNTTEIEITHTH